jgi:hypothetical protein
VLVAALTALVGCGRLGFSLSGQPIDHTPDANHRDAGTTHRLDAASLDAASLLDAQANADASDAARGAMDAAPPDATTAEDGETRPLADSGRPGSDGEVPIELCPERSDAVFCDGFEDPALSRWSYTVLMNGTVVRTSKPVRTGTASLRATTGAASGSTNNAARYGARAFAHQKSGDIWLRYYYYIAKSVAVKPFFSSGVVAEIEPPFFGFSMIILPDRVEIEASGTRYPGTMAFPRDRWTCVELHVQIDATSGVFEGYLDSKLVAHSPATNTLPENGYTSADVGIHYTDAAQGPVEVYVDDVVAALTRVGCN